MTSRKTWLAIALGVGLVAFAPSARADVWDQGGDTDNGSGTDNQLVHGTRQNHDLAALAGPTADQDWYRVNQDPFSSYEVVMDGTGGDLGSSASFDDLQLIASDNTTVLQNSVGIGNIYYPGYGYSKSLRFMNVTGSTVYNQKVRVANQSCGTGCGPEDVYSIRFYETTISVPRFNNAGGQVTVLIIQNPTNYTANGIVYFRSTAGAQVATTTFAIPPRGASVINTSTITGASGVSGTITIAHDARYGELAVKSVALEPSTGFSFDTPGLHRIH